MAVCAEPEGLFDSKEAHALHEGAFDLAVVCILVSPYDKIVFG